jgi:hypothetical protein
MDWNRFRSKHKGKGYTLKQLSKMYKQTKKVKATMKGKESESCKKCYKCVGPDLKEYSNQILEKLNKEELQKSRLKLAKNLDNCGQCNKCDEPIISKETLLKHLYNNGLMTYKVSDVLYEKGVITKKELGNIRESLAEMSRLK